MNVESNAAVISDISINDLFAVSSGMDEDGMPRAGSGLMIARLEDGQPKVLKNITYSVPVDVIGSQGAAVCAMEFERKYMSEYMRTLHACLEWLANEDSDEALFFSVIPFVLGGELSIVFQYLIHCEYYETKENKMRLVLFFDNTSTSLTVNEGIDIEQIQMSIESELINQEKELDEQLLALEDEEKELEEEISGYKYEFNANEFLDELVDDAETNDKNPRIRFVSNEEDDNESLF